MIRYGRNEYYRSNRRENPPSLSELFDYFEKDGILIVTDKEQAHKEIANVYTEQRKLGAGIRVNSHNVDEAQELTNRIREALDRDGLLNGKGKEFIKAYAHYDGSWSAIGQNINPTGYRSGTSVHFRESIQGYKADTFGVVLLLPTKDRALILGDSEKSGMPLVSFVKLDSEARSVIRPAFLRTIQIRKGDEIKFHVGVDNSLRDSTWQINWMIGEYLGISAPGERRTVRTTHNYFTHGYVHPLTEQYSSLDRLLVSDHSNYLLEASEEEQLKTVSAIAHNMTEAKYAGAIMTTQKTKELMIATAAKEDESSLTRLAASKQKTFSDESQALTNDERILLNEEHETESLEPVAEVESENESGI